MKDKTDAELIEEAEKLDFSDLLPFEMVQGDTIKRLQPHSSVVLNSSAAWLVSRQARAAHKMRAKPAEIEQALAMLPELASRLKAANEKLAGLTEIANQVADKRELKGQTRELFVDSGYEVKRVGNDGYLSNLPRKP